jgi:hypothetical protein
MIDQFEDENEQELEAVTDPEVLLPRMRECVGFACRMVGKVIRAEVGSEAFSLALEAAEASILAAIDLQRRYEQLDAECADSLNR